jgi:hypothetical protein
MEINNPNRCNGIVEVVKLNAITDLNSDSEKRRSLILKCAEKTSVSYSLPSAMITPIQLRYEKLRK